MRRLFYILSIAFIAQACEEIPPAIPTINTGGDRKVIMEEFSGAKCVPCAGAKADIDNLLGLYGENLIVVTIHSPSFPGNGDPVPGSKFDFRLDEGSEIVNLLGKPSGIPSGFVNRALFEGETDRGLNRQQWAGFVEQAINSEAELGMNMTTTFDPITRELSVNIAMVPAVNISGDVRLTVMITENNIIDKQETPDGRNDEYDHDHILRAVISAVNGDKISEALSSGVVIEKSYSFMMPDEDGWWVADNCNVVAFASRFDGEDLSILQADEVHVGD